MTTQPLPSGTTDADRIARTLARLRGPEIQPADGTIIAEDLRVQGQALADVRTTIARAVAQCHPAAATDLLADLEAEYGLGDGSALGTPARQQRLLAKYRARGDGSLLAIARTVRTLIPDAAFVTLASEDVAFADPAFVFALVILVADGTFDDTALRAQLDALLAQQATSHATWTVAVGAGPDIPTFLCDSPASLCDRNVLSE